MDSVSQKRCSKCGEWKFVNEFFKSSKSRDGHASQCKVCVAESCRESRKRRPGSATAYSRKYRETHPEKCRERTERWRAKNWEKLLESNRKSYERHVTVWGDTKKELSRIWRINNPEKAAASNRAYKARKKNSPGRITAKEWVDLKTKYNHTCLRCRRSEPGITLTLDHILPLSKGGEHTIENSQPLCFSCNSSKKDKYIDYR